MLLEQQWSTGKWKERFARRVNAFHWKNSYSRVKIDKLSSTCSKVLCQVHRPYVVWEIRSHQRADDKFLSQHWHSPDITAVKEMPWATSLGWILDQWRSNVRFSSTLLGAPSIRPSPMCRRAKESPSAGYLSADFPWWVGNPYWLFVARTDRLLTAWITVRCWIITENPASQSELNSLLWKQS